MYNREKLGNLLIDLAKIIFGVGFYSVIVKEAQDKSSFATASIIVSIAFIITSFIITQKLKK